MSTTIQTLNEGFNKRYYVKESRKLKEDYKISPDTEYQSKSGHKLIIKEVDPYISEYDGEANLRITYAYKLKDSNEWKTSKCNHKDFFNML